MEESSDLDGTHESNEGLKPKKDVMDNFDEIKELQLSRLKEPKREGAHHSLVLDCSIPDGHPAIRDLTVSPDPESGGVFILDVSSSGQKWRLVSTRDPTVIYIPKSVEKEVVLNKVDDVTGCHLIRVEFRSNDNNGNTHPLPEEVVGKKSHVSCFPSDHLIQKLITVFHGSERAKNTGREGKGCRGRGRGQRGGCGDNKGRRR